MSKLEEALKDKISVLEAEKIGLQEELEEAFQRIDSQIEVCESLLDGKVDGLLETKAAPKKRGRPKKVAETPVKKRGRPRKKKVDSEIEKARQQEYEEATANLPSGFSGTTKEEQEKAVSRFKPVPRPADSRRGVIVGSTKGKPPAAQESVPRGHKNISIEDDLPEEK